MHTQINAAETTEDVPVCDITSENVEPLQVWMLVFRYVLFSVFLQESLCKITHTLALKNEEISNFVCTLKQSLENLEVQLLGCDMDVWYSVGTYLLILSCDTRQTPTESRRTWSLSLTPSTVSWMRWRKTWRRASNRSEPDAPTSSRYLLLCLHSLLLRLVFAQQIHLTNLITRCWSYPSDSKVWWCCGREGMRWCINKILVCVRKYPSHC